MWFLLRKEDSMAQGRPGGDRRKRFTVVALLLGASMGPGLAWAAGQAGEPAAGTGLPAGWGIHPLLMEAVLVAALTVATLAALVAHRRLRLNRQRMDHLQRVILGIRSVNRVIASESDPLELVNKACGSLTADLGYLTVWIALFAEDGHTVAAMASSGFNGGGAALEHDLDQGDFPPCMRLALASAGVLVLDAPRTQCPDCPVSSEYGTQAGLSRRLAWNGRVFGTMTVSVPGPYAHDAQEQDLFGEMAEDLGLALHRIDLAKRLRESEELFRLTFDASPDAVNVNRLADGLYVDVNAGFIKLTGFSRQEVIGKTSSEIQIWHDPADRAELVRRLGEQGWCDNLEADFRCKDGRLATCLMSARVINLDSVPHIISITRDITARKRVENENRDKQGMLARTEEIAKVGSWEWDVQQDQVRWSEQLCRIFGLDPGTTPPSLAQHASLYVAEDLARLKEAVAVCVAEGTPYRLALRAQRPDGTIRHVIARGQPERDQAGLVHRLVGSLQDVTEITRSEAERERLLLAIEQVGEAIVITDPLGNIQYVNPAFEQVTGYTRDQVLGENPRLLKSGQHDQAFYEHLWQTISAGGTFQGQMTNRRRDGTLYTEEATISPVRDAAGQIVNYVAVKRDITEQLRLAEWYRQSQKMESVGRLAGGVAHDFNNMLSVILGHSELALTGVDPSEPLHGELRAIHDAARRSSAITRQLLAFARKQTIEPRVLDLNATVEGMLKMLRRLIGEDIDLVWRPDPRLWPVKMDPSQMEQVLANLCVNARDAIAGGGQITIETRCTSFDQDYCQAHAGFVPGDFVMLVAADNGCGIGREILDNIFEPFFTSKGASGGTGLGLATVYGIVKQNNGFINVYSEPGQGSIFRIYLPRHPGEVPAEGPKPQRETPLARGETVLLVEDEPAIRLMGEAMLDRLGYRVLVAGTPPEAQALAEEHGGGIDLLVTDVVMPVMDGRQLSEQLKGRFPGLKTLFMSGYTADVIAHRGVLEEGVHFIQKPFSLQELGRKVRGILDHG